MATPLLSIPRPVSLLTPRQQALIAAALDWASEEAAKRGQFRESKEFQNTADQLVQAFKITRPGQARLPSIIEQILAR